MIDTISIHYLLDEDNDGLTIVKEEELGTDPKNQDSDGDGLLDGIEVNLLETNPLAEDTDGNGIKDGDEDFDSDGITTIEEIEKGTDPFLNDTDLDGLDDGDEINIHHTDPLKNDTDSDGLDDGSEVKLGFNPLDEDTDDNGTKDSLEKTTQLLSETKIQHLSTKDNKAIPVLDIKAAGDIDEFVTVSDMNHNAVINSVPGIVGKPINIESDADFDEATVGFKLDDELLKDGKNLNDYAIVWFDEENSLPVPQETSYDLSTNTIYTTVDHFSPFFVVNTAILRAETDADNKSSLIEKGKADVVFAIDSTGSMGSSIRNVKDNIIEFVEKLEENKVDVRLGLVDYKDIGVDGLDSTKNLGWFYNPEEFKNKVNGISVNGGGDTPESAVDALEESRQMGFSENRTKFIILLTDAGYHEKTRFPDVNSMEEEIKRLKADGIITSVITSNTLASLYYDQLINETGGLSANIYGDFATELEKLIGKIGAVTNEKVTIRLSTNELIRLDKEPDMDDKETDTDDDGVPDSEELIGIMERGVKVPGVDEPVDVWLYNSNPDDKDTDDDGYQDDVDRQPKIPYSPAIVFLHGLNSNTQAPFGITNLISKSDNGGLIDGQARKLNPFVENMYSDQGSSRIDTEYHGIGFYEFLRNRLSDQQFFAFNYPNLGHPDKSAILLHDFLNNLVEEGQLQSPTISGDTKPQVIFIVHSMGGLVSRYYNEKLEETWNKGIREGEKSLLEKYAGGKNYKFEEKKVSVEGIITLATPHWGGDGCSLGSKNSRCCKRFTTRSS